MAPRQGTVPRCDNAARQPDAKPGEFYCPTPSAPSRVFRYTREKTDAKIRLVLNINPLCSKLSREFCPHNYFLPRRKASSTICPVAFFAEVLRRKFQQVAPLNSFPDVSIGDPRILQFFILISSLFIARTNLAVRSPKLLVCCI